VARLCRKTLISPLFYQDDQISYCSAPITSLGRADWNSWTVRYDAIAPYRSRVAMPVARKLFALIFVRMLAAFARRWIIRVNAVSPGGFPRSRSRELGGRGVRPSIFPSRPSTCPRNIAIYMRRPCFEPSCRARCAPSQTKRCRITDAEKKCGRKES
jgi:hypothetical protein